MGRKRSSGRPSASANAKGAPGSKINKMEQYEDTFEEGGVDDFMYKRDQIMFNPQNESDDEDVANVGEEVLSLEAPVSNRKIKAAARAAAESEAVDEAPAARKARKEKVKPDLSTKGRFGKPIPDSDDEDADGASGSGSGSDEDDDEGWGRQYYSRPSTRREKEGSDDDDSEREEEREMEEREVKRLQRKQREALEMRDFGLDDDGQISAGAAATIAAEMDGTTGETEVSRPAVPMPETTDPQALMAHLARYEPLKLALARELPLVVARIEKTSKGIKKMEEDEDSNLHKGLGWLHFQTLLTYAYTLAFCLHLCALPPSERPDLATHPILPRLLQLKTGLSQLEELDFDAASVSDVDPLMAGNEDDEEDEEDEEESRAELLKAKKELLSRMLEAGALAPGPQKGKKGGKAASGGYGVMQAVEGEEDDDEWMAEGLEDGELDDLMADADGDEAEDEDEDDEDMYLRMLMAKSGKEKKDKSAAGKDKKAKKAKKVKADETSGNDAAFAITAMEEPEFVSSSSSSKKGRAAQASSRSLNDDSLGDPTALLEADASDKDRQRRTLKFHTAKIAATSARREKARAQRLSGDEDIPYRDRQAARDAALRKNSAPGASAGEDLETFQQANGSGKGKGKRSADEADDFDRNADDNDAGAEEYYDLVKRRRTEKKSREAEEREERLNAEFTGFDEDGTGSGGPRALTRAIEKNKGLTPKRNKAGRNPRVKKRIAYEKAKKKVGSQRAVYKGGQASLGGSYQGEKTGISTKVKSRKF